jgi:hypothetical protein
VTLSDLSGAIGGFASAWSSKVHRPVV